MRVYQNPGFTLIELLIVIVIIGLMVLVAAPSYRRQMRQSMAAEGENLVSAIATAQKVYYVENNRFTTAFPTWRTMALPSIDSSINKYFRAWTTNPRIGVPTDFVISAFGGSYIYGGNEIGGDTAANGIVVTGSGSSGAQAVTIAIAGL